VLLLTDADLLRVMTVRDALHPIREAMDARTTGQLVAARRAGFTVGDAGLVWTPGGFLDTGALGLRLYPTGVAAGDQLTAVWDSTGRLDAIALGSALGRIRTAAIGGVAIEVLARPDSRVVGVIGFGAQGWGQVEAALAVRAIHRVLAYRRDPVGLARMAAEAERSWGVEVRAAGSPEEVARGADILITATGSSVPVLDARWLRPGTHINALGPKYRGRCEIGIDVVERADTIVCDVPEQYRAEPEFFLQGTRGLDRMGDLAAARSAAQPRPPQWVSLFLSHGLPGTEVRVLAAAARQARRLGIGWEVAGGRGQHS
jgi:ornithine cyclodeaminase/alanine dehydrogenase-like protein (mu-crystallin family)